MELVQFHQLRTAVRDNAAPGRGAELREVELTLRAVLMDSGLFEDVEVGHTDDLDRLVIALCTFRPFYSESDVAARLEQLWSDRVRYPFWEAHAVRTGTDHVEFEAASRVGPDGHFVTVHLVARKALIPAQRRRSSWQQA